MKFHISYASERLHVIALNAEYVFLRRNGQLTLFFHKQRDTWHSSISVEAFLGRISEKHEGNEKTASVGFPSILYRENLAGMPNIRLLSANTKRTTLSRKGRSIWSPIHPSIHPSIRFRRELISLTMSSVLTMGSPSSVHWFRGSAAAWMGEFLESRILSFKLTLCFLTQDETYAQTWKNY